MSTIKSVCTEKDYTAALTRIDELMDARLDSLEGDELDALADLVESYEARHVPMENPSPIAVIEFLMEQAGLSPHHLVPFIGSHAKVSQVLSGKQAITIHMARSLQWCWQVLTAANENRPKVDYKPGTVTLEFLKQVAQLSRNEEGPRLAQRFLADHGIPLVIMWHLPKTYLDGAALRFSDGRLVVGLTLRYDRIDSFWFWLLHELAHVGRHLDHNQGDAFVDDLKLRKMKGERLDLWERQADEWTVEALIPQSVWKKSDVKDHPTPISVINLATKLRVHPALVAGRVRYERKDYRLLSQFVGIGEVRQQFSGRQEIQW